MTELTNAPVCPVLSPLNDTERVVFYGASRFEQPKAGLRFQRYGRTLEVVSVEAERLDSLDPTRAWKFSVECREISV